jgi:hypothetical protein
MCQRHPGLTPADCANSAAGKGKKRRRTDYLASQTSAHAGRSITQRFLSLRGSGQRILAGCDCLLARVLQLVGLNRIELNIFREFRRNIRFRIDGVYGAYVYTCHAINAVLWMNNHLVLQFVEASDRAHLHTIRELAGVTFVGHDVGHGSGRLGCAKRLLSTLN